MMTAAYQIVLLLNKFTKLDLNYKKKSPKVTDRKCICVSEYFFP